MSRAEIESFLKSFLLFFGSLGILIATLFYINYTKEIQTLNEQLFSEMRLCSFDLKCEKFEIGFIEPENQKLYTLYKNEEGLKSYYPIPNSQKYIMELAFSSQSYDMELQKLQEKALYSFLSILAVVFVLSMLFSVYALYPLRSALLLTQEFIKDILHDFNTPLSSLRLNSAMLKKEVGDNEKIQRIEKSVENILSLQQHLRAYLQNHLEEKEKFEIKEIVDKNIYMLEKNYPGIEFKVEMTKREIFTNRDAFLRIVENIFSNAAKYNRADGFVKVSYNDKNATLHITDTGKGIKNPKRIFERFYKEQERGLGIGLHIVKKLSEELDIKIEVKSELGVGSDFSLNLSKLIVR
ncbi:MAG: HAMP domain-containing sensor histidine kinase [Sulfurimonas sp.]|uniref:sensor histidine kinase n=1 Tax=Sulfurimonas sp. TaxID=2022749 RepID=UPI0028CE133D|nr:HAMP domain-containing sensor histidine kinase [Sulfurimonas sp.]MDT8337751.1 HAMP domain-containing sensor histidine kinase [Sulfurimonas sp.]